MEKENTKKSFGAKLITWLKGNPIIAILIVASIVVGIMKENFFSWGNFSNLVSNTAVRFIIALGVSGI